MTNSAWYIITSVIVGAAVSGFAGYEYGKIQESHNEVAMQQKIDSLNNNLKISESINIENRIRYDSALAQAQKIAAKAQVPDTEWRKTIEKVTDSTTKVELANLYIKTSVEIQQLNDEIHIQANIIDSQDSTAKMRDSVIVALNNLNSRLATQVSQLNSSNSNKSKIIAIGGALLVGVTYIAIKK